MDLEVIPWRVIEMRGRPGSTHYIDTTPALSSEPVWTRLATVVLTNDAQQWRDRVSPGGAQRYCRMVPAGAPEEPSPGLGFQLGRLFVMLRGAPGDTNWIETALAPGAPWTPGWRRWS